MNNGDIMIYVDYEHVEEGRVELLLKKDITDRHGMKVVVHKEGLVPVMSSFAIAYEEKGVFSKSNWNSDKHCISCPKKDTCSNLRLCVLQPK